ncbi:MAG: hypothetical protein SFW67_04100 [Myxococcaceae bacterium]|nr:hypothetical protein [Myxococcaceae bacterium]
MTMLAAVLVFGALDVQWRAPPSCPAPDLSRLADSNGRAVVQLEADAASTWRLELTFVEPFEASRVLELSSCADAQRAARALLVLGLQGAEAFRASEVPVSAPPTVAPSAVTPPPVDRPTPVTVTARAGGLFSFASVPAGSGRFLAGADVRVGFFEAGLGLRVGLPIRFAASGIDGGAVTMWPTLGGEVTACWAPRSGRFTFGACGSLAAEWWQLTGQGVTDPGRGDAAWVAAGPLARATWRLVSSLEVGGALAFRAALRRPTAVLDGREVASAGPVSFEAQAFVGWGFGGAP